MTCMCIPDRNYLFPSLQLEDFMGQRLIKMYTQIYKLCIIIILFRSVCKLQFRICDCSQKDYLSVV